MRKVVNYEKEINVTGYTNTISDWFDFLRDCDDTKIGL